MNSLQFETSPYLLQHKENPVDWYPWGEEAFNKAKEEDKPVLLSIGYSACHWCHVMAHESFENPETAAIMNRHFVNVKVDREERPDIDNIYMSYVQITTGSGGWPLTVLLTPDKIPFFGGTYFPPQDKYGRPGFTRLLHLLSKTYKEKKEEIEAQTVEIIRALSETGLPSSGSANFTRSDFNTAYAAIYNSYDNEWGGFGKAPKFPQSMTLMFLLRYYDLYKNPDALNIVENSLVKMASGGIYDQLGGGFHRYSTDEKWLVPHFEKMLYDNSLLARVYLEAWQLTKNVYYLGVAEDILDYVLREMTDASGGFYSAQDADSEGEEGKFFVWSLEEIREILDTQDLQLAVLFYGIDEHGNFEGKNILTSETVSKVSQQMGISEKEFANRMSGIRKRLFNVREKRTHPGLDNKILTNWNALMLNAFILASAVTGKSNYSNMVRINADYIWNSCYKNGILYHISTGGNVSIEGNLDDYSYAAEAFLNLYEITFNEMWISRAGELIKSIINNFYNKDEDDFYFSPPREDLIVRTKDIYDNATPGAGSVTISVLIRGAKYLNIPEYEEIAHRYLKRIHDMAVKNPLFFSYALISALYSFNNPKETAVILRNDLEKDNVIKKIAGEFIKNSVIMGKTAGQSSNLELLKDKDIINEEPTFYVCSGFTCRRPVNTFEEFLEELKK